MFFESFKYYLASHIEKLRASESAGIAFGEILIQVMRINRRLISSAMRVAAYIPIFGSIVEPLIGSFEGFGELGESLGQTIKKSKGGIREVKVDLRRRDDLIEFF